MAHPHRLFQARAASLQTIWSNPLRVLALLLVATLLTACEIGRASCRERV